MHRYKLPLYLERKLYFSTNTTVLGYTEDGKKRYSTRYNLTALGREVRYERLNSQISAIRKRFQLSLSLPYPQSILDEKVSSVSQFKSLVNVPSLLKRTILRLSELNQASWTKSLHIYLLT